MTNERELWLTIRRGLLLIAGAIEQEPNAPPVLVAVSVRLTVVMWPTDQ